MLTRLTNGWQRHFLVGRRPVLDLPFSVRPVLGRAGRINFVLVVGIAAIAAVCASLLTSTLSQTHGDAIDRSKRKSAEFAAVLAGQTSRSVEAINLVLEELANKIASGVGENDHMLTHAGDEEKHRYLKLRLSRLPAAEGIAIVNSNGRIVNLTRSWPPPNVDISDRDHFLAVKAGASNLVISEPVPNRVNGETLVFFARRMKSSTGVFLGAIVAGARPDKLVDANAADAHVQGRTLVLVRRDGVLLAHSQSPKSAGSNSQHRRPGTRWLPKGVAIIDRRDISMVLRGSS